MHPKHNPSISQTKKTYSPRSKSSSATKKKKYDKNAKIQMILEQTLQIIQEQGLEGVYTKTIAKRANVSIGTLYLYFPQGIPSILQKIAQQSTETFLTPEFTAQFGALPLKYALHLLILRYLDVHRQNLPLVRTFEVQFLTHPDLFSNFHDFLQVDWSLFTKLSNYISELASIPEEILQKRMQYCYFLLETMTHRYLLYKSIITNDDEFVQLLITLLKEILSQK